MNDKFLKPYDSTAIEPGIYQKWLESGFFNPDVCIEKGVTHADAEKFSIILPPPNVTGTLHIGHASMLAIEDIMVRYNRMLGKRTLWLPGTDHAAIATQTKVEKELQKDKIRKQDLGREEFLKRVDAFAQESHDTIVGQVKKMGSSVDWTREAFTLDKPRAHAVFTAFKNMYDDGLIYRGDKIVNWDPKGQTVISDDEIISVEETTKFYYLKYGPFTIGTTRPETKFGDKYVVMHPDDARYAEYKHGDSVTVEWINGPITATIIKDTAIDMEFGTGAMTITPWHDRTDFDIAERHNLDKEQVIDNFGKLLPIAGEFAGMKISDAREKIIAKLAAKGLVEKIDEKYVHSVNTAERSGGVLEPQIMRQWFIAVNKEFPIKHSNLKGIKTGDMVTLKRLMQTVVETGEINIIPNHFNAVYYNWIKNLHDWCISRQIWYGHRIPVWYKDGEMQVSETSPGAGWEQDPDTLDTWFSSGLWTFSTLGWPEKTKDFLDYHPTNVLETGYDLIFFWVARMILMTTYCVGEIPFENVYMHGLVRDAKGQKMSKSIGNIIDPLDVIAKYGADAVRLSLIIGNGPGNDTKMSEDKIRAYKKFANKIWNATRFVLENVKVENLNTEAQTIAEDQKIIEEFNTILKDIDSDMKNFRLYLAGEKLYDFFWNKFANDIIENAKPALMGGDEKVKISKQNMLYNVLVATLKALHPFIPFVTEEIWQHLPKKDSELLMVSKWPIQ